MYVYVRNSTCVVDNLKSILQLCAFKNQIPYQHYPKQRIPTPAVRCAVRCGVPPDDWHEFRGGGHGGWVDFLCFFQQQKEEVNI